MRPCLVHCRAALLTDCRTSYPELLRWLVPLHLCAFACAGKPPHPLHRLDMNTSGVVLFAKCPDVVAAMHEQFRKQEVQKQYLALCLGVPAEATFTVEAGIGPHPNVK